MAPASSKTTKASKTPKDSKISKNFMDEINKKLDALLVKVDALSLDKKKEKKPKRDYKVPEDSERCTETRKNGERCAGRLAKGNKKQCQIHLNKSNGVDHLAAKKAKESKAKAEAKA